MIVIQLDPSTTITLMPALFFYSAHLRSSQEVEACLARFFVLQKISYSSNAWLVHLGGENCLFYLR